MWSVANKTPFAADRSWVLDKAGNKTWLVVVKATFDVQPDGSLKNQRQFVQLPTPGGDGLTIDSQGRLYVTAGPNVHVVASDGKLLGSIPAPYGLITAAFAGPDKKTMYAVVSLIDPMRLQHAYVYSIPMLAQGYRERAK